MKTVKQTMLVVLGLLFFALQGCSHEDYIPVPGPTGSDGTNGTNGINGTTTCESCHSNSFRDPIKASYALSVHAVQTMHATTNAANTENFNLTTSDYTNRTGCVQCHTSQGYIDKLNGDVLGTGLGVAEHNPAYPAGKQAISCKTCHETHSSFNFVADGNDFALRQGFTKVALDVDPSYKMDMGTSNTCVNCHQPRGLPPTSGDVKLSSRFGPHHGPQSTLLEGIQGALIVGSTPYPAPKSAGHRSGSSCVKCHMGKTTDGKDGAHTWHPTANTCITCHTSGAPTSVTGYAADMATLQGLLVVKGAWSTSTGAFTSNTVPIKVAQAAWNYALLLEDRSNGVHNPTYAKALLKNSIEALK
jgi:mono/diheme cytochrome c family protein